MKFVLITMAVLLCVQEILAHAEIQQDVVQRDTIGGTGAGGGGDLSQADIDTFAELDAIVSDEGLVNLNDAQTLLNKVIDGNSNTVKMLRSATDCIAYNGAVDGQYCWEQDSDTLYVCETADVCDTPGEWDAVAAGGSPLTVEESDANPTVSNVNKIQFDQADGFSVTDETGGQVQVDLTLTDSHIPDNITASLYCLLTGCTFTGVIELDNLGLSQPASDINPTCSSGDFKIYSDLSENKWKKCQNGVVSDLDTDTNTDAVSSVYGRTGAVTAATSDYDANQIDNTPAGNIAATDAQAAINELDSEKAALAKIKTLVTFRPPQNEPPASNFATIDTRNSHPVLDFDATTNECTNFTFIMPQAYSGGGVTIYIHYAMTSATSGDVDWNAAFERIGDQQQDIDADSFAAAQSVIDTTVPATSGNVDVVSIAFTNGAQMDSCAAGEACRIQLCRGASADTATGDAELVMLEMRES